MSNSSQRQHEMVMVRELKDGKQEWLCPSCGRRIILQWPPDYQHVVVIPGDESVSHAGAMGGVQDSQPAPARAHEPAAQQILAAESLDLPGDPVPDDDPYLEPWMKWLDGQDL